MSTKLNVALTLPPQVQRAVLPLSQTLGNIFPTFFQLNGKEYSPHVPVYASTFLDGSISDVLGTVERIAGVSRPLECTVRPAETHQGYVGIGLVRTESLMNFHRLVLHEVSPLRRQVIDGRGDYDMEFTPEQIENEKKWGYADADKLYNPYFTITRTQKPEDGEKALRMIGWSIAAFTVSSIGVFEMGDHGTCRKLLAQFALTKQEALNTL